MTESKPTQIDAHGMWRIVIDGVTYDFNTLEANESAEKGEPVFFNFEPKPTEPVIPLLYVDLINADAATVRDYILRLVESDVSVQLEADAMSHAAAVEIMRLVMEMMDGEPQT